MLRFTVAKDLRLHNYVLVRPRALSKPKVIGEVTFHRTDGVKKCHSRQLVFGFFDQANNEVYKVDMVVTYSKRL